jgi:hypothetical protein
MGLNKNVDIEISVQDDCFAKNWMKNKNIQNFGPLITIKFIPKTVKSKMKYFDILLKPLSAIN